MQKQSTKTSISEEAIDQLFREARTHSAWRSEPVPAELLRKIYGLTRLGPTSANSCRARFVFLMTAEGKARRKRLGSIPCEPVGESSVPLVSQ